MNRIKPEDLRHEHLGRRITAVSDKGQIVTGTLNGYNPHIAETLGTWSGTVTTRIGVEVQVGDFTFPLDMSQELTIDSLPIPNE